MILYRRGKIIAVIAMTFVAAIAFAWQQFRKEMRAMNCASDHRHGATETLRKIAKEELRYHRDLGRYTSDLAGLSWQPADGAPVHVFGFAAPFVPSGPPHHLGADPSRHHSLLPEVASGLGLDARRVRTTAADLPGTAVASSSAFVVAAVGNIDADDTLDILTIDEKQELRYVSDDCRR